MVSINHPLDMELLNELPPEDHIEARPPSHRAAASSATRTYAAADKPRHSTSQSHQASSYTKSNTKSTSASQPRPYSPRHSSSHAPHASSSSRHSSHHHHSSSSSSSTTHRRATHGTTGSRQSKRRQVGKALPSWQGFTECALRWYISLLVWHALRCIKPVSTYSFTLPHLYYYAWAMYTCLV